MKKTLSLSLLILFLPVFVSAAWWNPFTWFKADEVQKIDPAPVENTANTSKNQEDALQDNTKVEVIEKVIEKPVTQTITVQDPNLQIKINSLLSENITLKTENFSLKTQVERLLKSNQSLNENLNICENRAVSAPKPEIKPNVIFNVTLTEKYDTNKYNFKTEGDDFRIKSFAFRIAYGSEPMTFYINGGVNDGKDVTRSESGTTRVGGNTNSIKWEERKSCDDNPGVYGCSAGLIGYAFLPDTLIPAGTSAGISWSSGNRIQITGITLEGVKSGKQITY